MSNVFKTTVLGVGPWCVEFSDGEIVPCRTEDRAKLIAAAPDLLEALQEIVRNWDGEAEDMAAANAAIAKATR